MGASVCYRVMWFACHRCVAYRQVAGGGDSLQVQKVVAKVLNKQSRTVAEKWWLCNFGVGWENNAQDVTKVYTGS
jgi:hypothetical protein